MLNNSSFFQDEDFDFLLKREQLFIKHNSFSLHIDSCSVCKILQKADLISNNNIKNYILFTTLPFSLLNEKVLKQVNSLYIYIDGTEIKMKKKDIYKIMHLSQIEEKLYSCYVNLSIIDEEYKRTFTQKAESIIITENEPINKDTLNANEEVDVIEVKDTSGNSHSVYKDSLLFCQKIIEQYKIRNPNQKYQFFDCISNELFTVDNEYLNKDKESHTINETSKKRYLISVARIRLINE